MVGSLKEHVLLTVADLGPDVLTADVYAAIDNARKTAGGKGLTFAAVFNTIQRLVEQDKMLSSRKGPKHRGRQMMIYTINARGRAALNEASLVRAYLSDKKRKSKEVHVGPEGATQSG